MAKGQQFVENDSQGKIADSKQPTSPSRRRFLGKAGGVTAAMVAASSGVPSLLAGENARGEGLKRRSTEALVGRTGETETRRAFSSTSNPVGGALRRLAVFRTRFKAAVNHLRRPLSPQVNNGDEALYASENYIGSYTKAMPHDSNGLVSASDYQKLLTAVTTGKPSDFVAIPLGGDVPFSGPQSGLTMPLIGADHAATPIPPAPTFASQTRADEMIENYWQALLRDVPFASYSTDPNVAAAIAELNKLGAPNYLTPVTPQNLFRGFTVGETVGPYVSQFVMMPMSGLGALSVNTAQAQLYNLYAAGVDYMTDSASWLAVQNGQATVPSKAKGVFFAFGNNEIAEPGYLFNGRSLAALVHTDELFQHYFWAAGQLLGEGFPVNPGSPYLGLKNQNAFSAVGGGPFTTGILGIVANQAIQDVWYQKWFVHRPLRPEEYAGRVQNVIVDKLNFPVHSEVLNSTAAAQVFSKYGTYYLPMAYPEGCPTHPSYGSGHTTVAAACATALKALFNDSTTFVSMGITPVYSPDGVSLLDYTGSDVDQITVGSELNKLVSNIGIGRNIAGVHWQSDYAASVLLGETVTINILQDMVNCFNEPVSFQFTSFTGQPVVVQKS